LDLKPEPGKKSEKLGKSPEKNLNFNLKKPGNVKVLKTWTENSVKKN